MLGELDRTREMEAVGVRAIGHSLSGYVACSRLPPCAGRVVARTEGPVAAPAVAAEAGPPTPATGAYGRHARVLSVGIASSGLLIFVYFAVVSHVLSPLAYKRVSVLWAVVFVIVSVIYRPIEQLLSRTIAERRARGMHGAHPLRVPATIQLSFAVVFLAIALGVHDTVQAEVFNGSATLYWILVVSVLAYAGSFFTRGWLAGHQSFAFYGSLLVLEATSRLLFALAVAIGIAHGQSAAALGIAAGPLISLSVVPFALTALHRHRVGSANPTAPLHEGEGELSLRHGAGFALAVLAIMAAEQALLNGPVLLVDATATDRALAGFVFNVMLISRAPLLLFQAIQTSLLPHLTGLATNDSNADIDHMIKLTALAIAGFAGAVAVGLLAIGPPVMRLVFGGHHFHYARGGLLLIGLGMGMHLISGTLNQVALARRQAPMAAGAWLTAAAAFIAWVAFPSGVGEVLRVEIGYLGATLLLSGLLLAVYRHGRRQAAPAAAAISA